jgi:hypothetical protein
MHSQGLGAFSLHFLSLFWDPLVDISFRRNDGQLNFPAHSTVVYLEARPWHFFVHLVDRQRSFNFD